MGPMCPIAHVPHHPCPPSRSSRYWQYSLNTWSCTCSPCAHVISQVSKRCQVVKKMSSCQKDVKLSKRCQVVKKMSNVKKSNTWTMEEVHKKNKLTQWGSQILTSILTSQMMVTKNPQNIHRKYFWAILVTFTFDVKINVNICEPHDVNLFFLWTSSIVCIFDFFIFDIFLTAWHIFDNLTSFWHLTYNMGTWWTCAGSCVQWILPILIRSRWGTGVMGHMGNGAHGQWGPWVIGTFWHIN